jgi:hypothetical protein
MREPLLIIATGQKGVGKTYTTKQLIAQYTQSNPHTQKKGRKVLIYDVNMEYTQFKAIALKDLKKFTMQKRVEVRRVLPRMENGRIATIDEMMEIMNVILESYAGGLLILEDINRYLIGTQTQDIIGTIATNRHRDLDIIIHLQSLAAVTPRMWQNTSSVRFHKQMDSIDRYMNRIPYFEILKIAQILVENQYDGGNERFYCYVSGDESYVKGEFSKRSFQLACEEYSEKYPKALKLAMTRIGNGDKGESKRTKALNQVTDALVKKYYGNGQ